MSKSLAWGVRRSPGMGRRVMPALEAAVARCQLSLMRGSSGVAMLVEVGRAAVGCRPEGDAASRHGVPGCVGGLRLRDDALAEGVEDAVVAREVARLDLVGGPKQLCHISPGIGAL
jgi:hypothetical protein